MMEDRVEFILSFFGSIESVGSIASIESSGFKFDGHNDTTTTQWTQKMQ